MTYAQIGTVENQVLIGYDEYLFLAGGAHNVLDIVSGRLNVAESSYNAFRENMHSRLEWANNRQVRFLHIIFPDKQSIIPEKWPLSAPLRLGELFRTDAKLNQHVSYPADFLAMHAKVATSRVDTHLTARGAILVAGHIAGLILGRDEHSQALVLADQITSDEIISGDLGSKLSPPLTKLETVCRAAPPGVFVSNHIRGGNNGITDIRFNTNSPYPHRIAIFGDSFGRQFARYLQYWFAEVSFFRTGFFHEEVASALKPDVLITENSERYLDSCKLDDQRNNYFMIPYSSGTVYSPPPEFVSAFSAILSFPRQPYQLFKSTLHSSM